MKRIILLPAAFVLLAVLLCGCKESRTPARTSPSPRVTSNVTATPAPVTPTITPDVSVPTPGMEPSATPYGELPGLENGVYPPVTDEPTATETPAQRGSMQRRIPGGAA